MEDLKRCFGFEVTVGICDHKRFDQSPVEKVDRQKTNRFRGFAESSACIMRHSLPNWGGTVEAMLARRTVSGPQPPLNYSSQCSLRSTSTVQYIQVLPMSFFFIGHFEKHFVGNAFSRSLTWNIAKGATASITHLPLERKPRKPHYHAEAPLSAPSEEPVQFPFTGLMTTDWRTARSSFHSRSQLLH